MGRVYRQGQTKPCTIYRLFSAGTVEEVVYQRQAQKGGLATLTVDAASNKGGKASPNANNAKFSKEELRDCFTLKPDIVCDTKRKIGKRWPDYDGPDSLLDCIDEPLLTVARTMPETLRFVHIVTDADDENATETHNNDDDSSDDGSEDEAKVGQNDESSDSENEFE